MSDDQDVQEEATDAGAAPPPAFDPPIEFGDFEGRPVVGIVTKINGTSSRITRPLHNRSKGYVLIEYEVSNVAHPVTDEGQKRHQTLKTLDLYELASDLGAELVAAERKRLLDAGLLDGQLSIDDAPTLVVDGSGVALTPTEIAERNGGVDGVEQLANGKLSEPWLGYVGQSVAEVKERLAALDTVDACQAVITFELENRSRMSVINAAGARRGEIEAAEPR